MNIYSIFKDHYPWWSKEAGTFGIEIETETKSHKYYPEEFSKAFGNPSSYTDAHGNSHTYWPSVPLKLWKAVEDGSLRDFGVEYVLKDPLPISQVEKALAEFKEKLGEVPFLTDSPSTSVHVHINMLNEVPLTLANMLALWTLFENVLIEYCGPSRRSNFFAAPIRTTEGIRDNFVKLIQQLDMGSMEACSWSDSSVKYAALNIATLYKFGSIEIRPMRGLTNADDILQWVYILNEMYLYAKTPGLTPKSLLEDYRVLGHALVFKVFGKYAPLLMTDNITAMMERNESYVMDLCMPVKNWDVFGMAYVKPKEKTTVKVKAAKLFQPAGQLAQAYSLDQFLQGAPATAWLQAETTGFNPATAMTDDIELPTEENNW